MATPTSAPAPRRRLLLRPAVGWQPVNLADLWHYRELLWILAMRDVKVRYKQTALGAAWAIIQPLLMMLAFTVLAEMGSFSTNGVPPALFEYTGLIIWQLFSNSMANAGNSLITNQNLITKIYFPRLIIPMAAIVTGLVDFAVAFALQLLLMAWYHWLPGPQILLLPFFVALAFFASLAVGLWLSALNVEFRDVRYVIPFLVQFWIFVTPVLFSSTQVTKTWKRVLLGINPMSGVVEGFRWCMLGRPAPGAMLVVSIVSILGLLVSGAFYFRRMEKSFADVV